MAFSHKATWLAAVLSAAALAVAHPAASPSAAPSTTTTSAAPVSTACGDLIRRASSTETNGTVNAVEVYNCFLTVPFNADVATRFVKYWNDTLQFHGTLDFLKAPPTGYQQPAVDLIAGLAQVQQDINDNKFINEYQFESALQNVLFSANDPHVSLLGGVLSSFSFGAPVEIASISLDGVALPKTYFWDDLIANQSKASTETWQPSAIKSINGTDAMQFLSLFASLNSQGTVEPNGDWNTLVRTPVVQLFSESIFGTNAMYYPGDNFQVTFENGTTYQDKWKAYYYNPGATGPLETGGDFYNFFVLGFYPQAYLDSFEDIPLSDDSSVDDASAPSNSTDSSPASLLITSWGNFSDAYPDTADVYQPSLGYSGLLTGYFLQDTSIAVLSIPQFAATEGSGPAFSSTVDKFLSKAKAAGMQKVVIDLQGNTGGEVLLAISTFKQFFPAIQPYGGSNMRAHDLGDRVGNSITLYYNEIPQFDQTKADVMSNEWIATTKLNPATGRNFTSWRNFFGPLTVNNNPVTNTMQLDILNPVFDWSAMGQDDPPVPLVQPTDPNSQTPYTADNIILLTDGACSSACALFSEMMRQQGGVRSVVIGGRPMYGPMQSVTGSRAARLYQLSDMDNDLAFAFDMYGNNTVDIPDRTQNSLFFYSGSVSLRNQVRQGDSTPLQMQFEAADCRIFWTPETFNNFNNLWRYAANAIWSNSQLCVKGSTGYTDASAPDGSSKKPAPAAIPISGLSHDDNGVLVYDFASLDPDLITPFDPMPDGPFVGKPASASGGKTSGTGRSGSFTSSSKPQNLPSQKQDTGVIRTLNQNKNYHLGSNWYYMSDGSLYDSGAGTLLDSSGNIKYPPNNFRVTNSNSDQLDSSFYWNSGFLWEDGAWQPQGSDNFYAINSNGSPSPDPEANPGKRRFR